MSKRQVKRLMREAQEVAGISRRELLQMLEEAGPAATDVPPPAPVPVNPLIRPASKRTS